MPSKLDVKCVDCPTMIARQTRSGRCQNCFSKWRRQVADSRAAARPAHQIQVDREKHRLTFDLSLAQKKYAEALKTIQHLERSLEATAALKTNVGTFEIQPREGSGTSEGTVFAVASDWHSEERVKPETVSNLNSFTLEDAKSRATRFFQSSLRLTRLLQQDIKINTMVVPLLGDFISNDIHEEAVELAQLEPMHAITFARDLLVSGVEFLLEHSKLELVFPCHSGNHARTTRKPRNATESGHSLEYLMYLHLADYFRKEKRVTFQVAPGYHSYLEVYGQTIRLHHGHDVQYQGGVGGIYIPVNKAIAQWNKGRHADLDVFGHFHQMRDGGNFICNGSLIGYNAFALAIKADYEPPKQALFLMDKKRGRTCTWPILLT
jgi:hypothetical protein